MSTEVLVIGPDRQVTLHFSLSFLDGSVIDSTRNGDPAVFVVGDESLLPGFEKALFGLKAGDRRSIFIEAKSGFGEYNEANVHFFPRSQFDPETLQEGVVISFADPSKSELPGVIKKVESDRVQVDFNHPLAGKDLTFEVEIFDVQAAPQTVSLKTLDAGSGANQ